MTIKEFGIQLARTRPKTIYFPGLLALHMPSFEAGWLPSRHWGVLRADGFAPRGFLPFHDPMNSKRWWRPRDIRLPGEPIANKNLNTLLEIPSDFWHDWKPGDLFIWREQPAPMSGIPW
jgi:hypothetical protein